MICPESLVATTTALSIAIAQGKSINELNLLSAIFNQIGETLETIVAQRECLENND